MKIKNPETRKLILYNARQEFLEKGFRGATLRTIANRVEGTTGIIYTYFKNKDEIFAEIIKPVTVKIEDRLVTRERGLEERMQTEDISPRDWFTQNLRYLIDLIETHPVEMKLLFLRADGSQFEDYKDTLIERGIKKSVLAFRNLKRSEGFTGQELSEFFVRTLVMHVINIAVELIKQKISRKEITKFEYEIVSFLYGGWQALVKF